MKEEKRRWKGVFNWFGEIHTLWCWASSEAKAKQNFVRQIAESVGVVPGVVSSHYTGHIDNFSIKENMPKEN